MNYKKLAIISACAGLCLTLAIRLGLNLQFKNIRTLRSDKNISELEYYGCLFRSKKVDHKEYCDLLGKKYKFSQHVLLAAKSFDIPYDVLFCTVLIESGFNAKARNSRNAGYGQFGELAVKEIKKISKKQRYKQMWELYLQQMPPQINKQNVMYSKDPKIAIGAIAAYERWMFDRIDKLDCNGCGADFFFTDKKIALMIAGYNWSPYKFKKMLGHSIEQLIDPKNSPLPQISRRYIQSMDKCRNSSEYESLREGHSVQKWRIKQCTPKVCGQ